MVAVIDNQTALAINKKNNWWEEMITEMTPSYNSKNSTKVYGQLRRLQQGFVNYGGGSMGPR